MPGQSWWKTSSMPAHRSPGARSASGRVQILHRGPPGSSNANPARAGEWLGPRPGGGLPLRHRPPHPALGSPAARDKERAEDYRCCIRPWCFRTSRSRSRSPSPPQSPVSCPSRQPRPRGHRRERRRPAWAVRRRRSRNSRTPPIGRRRGGRHGRDVVPRRRRPHGRVRSRTGPRHRSGIACRSATRGSRVAASCSTSPRPAGGTPHAAPAIS